MDFDVQPATINAIRRINTLSVENIYCRWRIVRGNLANEHGGPRAGQLGFSSRQVQNSPPPGVHTLSVANPVPDPVNTDYTLSFGVKWPEREAHHNFEPHKAWSLTSAPVCRPWRDVQIMSEFTLRYLPVSVATWGSFGFEYRTAAVNPAQRIVGDLWYIMRQ
jgi:hypothetical protein